MKKLILILTILFAGITFGQESKIPLLFASTEGNLRDLANSWFYTSGNEVLNVLGGKYTLTQTGAQVQTILDGTFASNLDIDGDLYVDQVLRLGDQDATGYGTLVFEAMGDETTQTPTIYIRYASANTDAAGIQMQKSRGTIDSPTPPLKGDNLSTIAGGGYDGSAWQWNKGAIFIKADSLWAVGEASTKIVLATTLDNSRTERFVIYSSNNSFLKGDLINDGAYNFNSDAQADDDYEISLPEVSTLTTGMTVTFIANTANTDGATLEITEVGDLDAILKMHDQALATNDIEAGQVVVCVFDGTNWQMTSQIAQ